MKNWKILTLVFVFLLLLGAVFFWWSMDADSSVSQNETSQETAASTEENSSEATTTDDRLTVKNELQEVNFCGETYQSKHVFIDGVEVVGRLAELAQQSKNAFVCKNIKGNSVGKKELQLDVKKHPKNSTYLLEINSIIYIIDPKKEEILYANPAGYDPTLLGSLQTKNQNTLKNITIDSLKNESPEKIEAIDNHLIINHEPKKISFCGTTYRSEQLFIDGIAVLDRIAELAEKEETKEEGRPLCSSINQSHLNTNILEIDVKKVHASEDAALEEGFYYMIYIPSEQFKIDVFAQEIYFIHPVGYGPSYLGEL